jgi:NYN domain
MSWPLRRGKDGGTVDRCALFVDASYVLADGAMAVHGTRRTESVSWDYEGLLQLLSRLARERSGLPVLRCYWYEATMDGRRTAEQDALADVPGIKLRVAKIRPGRREGVETEIHRDLTTLARNNAISDALVVSAEEDLAQVIADVQDLGMRVTLVHIAVDGNWTISRALRQESDEIIEISGDHLRPYVELVAGAEPAHPDDDGDLAAVRPLANGHSIAPAASYQQAPAAGNHAPPAIYTAPVVAEYQRPALQLPRSTSRDDRARDDRTREERTTPTVNGDAPAAARQDIQSRQDMPARDLTSRPDLAPRPDIYTAPATAARSRPEPVPPAPQNPAARARVAEEPVAYAAPAGPVASAPQVQVPQVQVPQGTPEPASGADATQPPAGQLRRLPSARTAVSQGQHGVQSQPGQGQHSQGQHSQGQHSQGQHGVQSQPGQGQSGQGSPRSAPYSGPQPVMNQAAPAVYQAQNGAPAVYQAQNGAPGVYQAQNGAPGVSLSEAVQAAHEEGQEFGGSVARDAPALWLEAVLARKPRMPSDLEARLLQGSALPIDFLLHDEVRHALRRGFWDALERTRR